METLGPPGPDGVEWRYLKSRCPRSPYVTSLLQSYVPCKGCSAGAVAGPGLVFGLARFDNRCELADLGRLAPFGAGLGGLFVGVLLRGVRHASLSAAGQALRPRNKEEQLEYQSILRPRCEPDRRLPLPFGSRTIRAGRSSGWRSTTRPTILKTRSSSSSPHWGPLRAIGAVRDRRFRELASLRCQRV